jgi:hypothetical protein
MRECVPCVERKKEMSATASVISSIRPPMPLGPILSVLERSHKQRFIYSTLLRDGKWQTLSETCLSDLQKAASDVLIVTAAMRDLEALRIETNESVETLKLATKAREGASKSTKRKLKRSKPPQVARKYVFPKRYDRVPRLAAHHFMLQQSAALKYLIQAEASEVALAANKSGAKPRKAKVFWKNLQMENLSCAVAKGRDALNRRQEQIYICSLGDRCRLASALHDLVDWVPRDLRVLLDIQSAVSLLLANEGRKSNSVTLHSLSIEAGVLVRELVASYLASLVSLLAIKGVALNPNVANVVARAGSTPLHGRMHGGKYTDIRRLGRLPEGMFVRMEGVLASAEFVERGNKSYFSAELQDGKGKDTIRIIAPFNLLADGVGAGSHVKLSGFYRKAGAPLFGRKHVEIEPLKIRDIYSRDIWNVAFLNLSSPYFRRWPADLHIAFQPVLTPTVPNAPVNDAEEGDDCFDQQENFNDAVLLANITGQQVTDATWGGQPSVKAYLRLHCLDFSLVSGGGTTVDCSDAINQLRGYLDAGNPALEKYFKALMDAAKARQALSDCIWGAWEPPESEPEEEIPDWVLDFESEEDSLGHSV